MTQRVRGRGETPTMSPPRYYAWNPAGEKQKEPVRLTAQNKARHERMGWTFKAVG